MLIKEDVEIYMLSLFNVKTNSLGVRAHSLRFRIPILIIVFLRNGYLNQNKFQMLCFIYLTEQILLNKN